MGGPINKAAYVTGTGLLASGEFHVMAAVMAGGMVPPLAIALCTTFFKNRFTESERKAGITNYVMGLSFITEGAIPFAAADPLRVIPACVVGSAVTGALTMAFDCTLRAPQKGFRILGRGCALRETLPDTSETFTFRKTKGNPRLRSIKTLDESSPLADLNQL